MGFDDMPPPATVSEWAEMILSPRSPVYEMAAGHYVGVVKPGNVQALCTCGWHGPDRTGDAHAAGLVIDDVHWHAERVADDAAALASSLGSPPPRMWWQR